MMYILAILLPFLAVMLSGKIFTGILLLMLQLTLFGWIPAALIALLIVKDKVNKEALRDAVQGDKV